MTPVGAVFAGYLLGFWSGLVYTSSSIVAEQGNPDVMMNILMLVYFFLILAVVTLFDRAKRWVARDARS